MDKLLCHLCLESTQFEISILKDLPGAFLACANCSIKIYEEELNVGNYYPQHKSSYLKSLETINSLKDDDSVNRTGSAFDIVHYPGWRENIKSLHKKLYSNFVLEKPCRHCKKLCDVASVKCWWCECPNPI